MSNSIFSSGKNSQANNYDYKADYNAFFAQHKGAYVDIESPPPFSGRLTPTRKGMIRRSIAKMIAAATDGERKMYGYMAVALTDVCIAIADCNGQDKCLIFVPNSDSRIKSMPDNSEIELPDLVAFIVHRKNAAGTKKKYPDVPSAFMLDGSGELKARTDADVEDQALRYLFSDSRHHPCSFLRHGLIVNNKHFRLITLGLDNQFRWPAVKWTDKAWVEHLYSYVDLVVEEAMKEHPQSIPRFLEEINLGTKPIGVFEATVGGIEYSLLPIFTGRGNGRKPFVALGSSKDDSNTRVFKYSWYSKEQAGRERTILEKLKDAPGIVRIDSELSQSDLEENEFKVPGVDVGQEVLRKRSLLVLSTVAYPLCACESVLEFLEAMYDLLEVLRYIAQEKNVLHRDISWSNVLIRPKEFGDVISLKETNAEMKEDQVPDGIIRHKYRFICDIFHENERKIKVALADFDHAIDLDKSEKDELKNATGTPMFMAEDVLSVRSVCMYTFSVIPKAVKKEVLDTWDGKHADPREKQEWDNFYQNSADLRWKISPEMENTNLLEESFKHGAVHDAESVYHLCLLFFNRMWPFDELVDRSERSALEVNRGKLFTLFQRRACEENPTRFQSLQRTSFGEGPRFEPFYTMLVTMFWYLRVPWYNVETTGRCERHEFHLHELMQRLLLKEIRRLRTSKDPIPIEPNPVGVRTPAQRSGNTYTTACSQLFATSAQHREKAGLKSQTLPVLIPKEMSLEDEKFEKFSPLFWDIYCAKRREKLWLVADRLYRSTNHKN